MLLISFRRKKVKLWNFFKKFPVLCITFLSLDISTLIFGDEEENKNLDKPI